MSDTIDATVVLGLAGKVSQVFAETGSYLSFPLTAIGIERAKFHSLAADPLSLEGQNGLTEFSLLVNELPNGPLWQSSGSQRLWDVYSDVLGGSHLAEASRTAAEEATYHNAYELLYKAQSDGSLGDSPAVISYQQYRDAFLALTQEYNNRHGQAEITDDSAIKLKWAEDEPILQAHMKDAEQDWAIKGNRYEIEEARRALREIGSKSAVMAWAGYRKLFDPDLPEVFFRSSVPEGWMYVPTSYMPSDVVEMAWPSITLARNDLMALTNSAPAELRSRLGSSQDAAIDLVSFEYSSVTLNRGWFAPEVFASRAWNFYESDRILSDGGQPPNGQCTAYVSGLVLARNISVRRVTAAGTRSLSLAFVPSEQQTLTRLPIAPPEIETALMARVEARRALQLKNGTPEQVALLQKPRTAIAVTAAPTPVALRAPIYATENPAVRVQTAGLRPAARQLGLAAIRPADDDGFTPVRRMPIPYPPRLPVHDLPEPQTPDPAPQKLTTTTTTTDPNHVYILAFVCRLLPKCPNPDSALKW